MAEQRTLVIIPAYNEEESLPAVLKELAEQTPQYDVLVVSDGSTDRTAELALASGVHVATLPFNLGIGGALRTGFTFAVRRGYERAVQFDADGQHDPLAVERAARRPRPRRRHGDRQPVRRRRRGHLRGERRAAPRHEAAAVARRRARAPALHRHQLGVPRLLAADARVLRRLRTRSSTWTRSRRWCRRATAASAWRRSPANMRGRTGGAPSTRNFKLVYYYVRLLVVLLVSTTSRGQRARRTAQRDGDDT